MQINLTQAEVNLIRSALLSMVENFTLSPRENEPIHEKRLRLISEKLFDKLPRTRMLSAEEVMALSVSLGIIKCPMCNPES